jgi:hypothetical protein
MPLTCALQSMEPVKQPRLTSYRDTCSKHGGYTSVLLCDLLLHLAVALPHRHTAARVVGERVDTQRGGHWADAPAQHALGGNTPRR